MNKLEEFKNTVEEKQEMNFMVAYSLPSNYAFGSKLFQLLTRFNRWNSVRTLIPRHRHRLVCGGILHPHYPLWQRHEGRMPWQYGNVQGSDVVGRCKAQVEMCPNVWQCELRTWTGACCWEVRKTKIHVDESICGWLGADQRLALAGNKGLGSMQTSSQREFCLVVVGSLIL